MFLMQEEIKLWWELALDDLDTAKKNLEFGKYHIASLFSQQAVEKALKAFYIKTFNELKKTHDLVFLSTKLGLPENYRKICKRLDPVYTGTRYPDVSGQLPSALFEKNDAEEFIKTAEEVILWVKKKL